MLLLYSVMPRKGQGIKLVLYQNLPFKNIHIWPGSSDVSAQPGLRTIDISTL